MKPAAWPLLAAAAAAAVAACSALPLIARKPQPASNDRCHVCHINYADDKLAVSHARHGIGCERCHGPSDEHCGSETHEIAPDRMYTLEQIGPGCMECHPKNKLLAQDMHALNLVTTPEPKKHCTECHGTHRLARREVRWDKATGKLLPPPS